ncbi:hypothetical protein [Phyllobacterium sp. CL33Tsu]|uniref:hypothetical protein n=1 Tax=Phyllobacterium sp. CL33Tsu TaxID=1798191 RepID=UPI001113C822|nr:hypothetical protein [Phyllobacterium sp. CL33Tsu]
MRLPPWPGLSPQQEEQRVIAVENMRLTLLSSLAVIAVAPVFWFLYRGPLQPFLCIFRDNPYLLKLWPSNQNYVLNFAQGAFSPEDQCFFFAMTSSFSFLWLVWLALRTFRELRRVDTFYIKPWLSGYMIATPVCMLGSYFNYFGVSGHLLQPGLSEPIAIGTLKILFCITAFYYMLGALFEQLLLYRRRDKTIPKFRP